METKPERDHGPTPEELFYTEVFATHPPLPVGGAMDAAVFEAVAETNEPLVPAYAWERVVAYLASTKNVREATKGPILMLDICSSVPVLTELARSAEFGRCGRQARAMVQTLLRQAPAGEFSRLSEALPVDADKSCYELLQAAVQEVLYQLTIEESTDVEVLQATLLQKLATQQTTYDHAKKGDTEDAEVDWKVRFTTERHDENYASKLASTQLLTEDAIVARQLMHDLPSEDYDVDELLSMIRDRRLDRTWRDHLQVKLGNHALYGDLLQISRERPAVGKDLADQYIEWQAAVLANMIARNHECRPVRFLSMDMLPPGQIIQSSLANTPSETQQMEAYTRALASLLDPLQHITGDILNRIPVPPDRVMRMTCIDGWPFYSELADSSRATINSFVEDTAGTLERLYDVLTFGGQLIVFPWAVRGLGRKNQWVMRAIQRELGDRLEIGVDTRMFTAKTLRGWMSAGDRQLSKSSGSIFASRSKQFDALLVTKRRESLERRFRVKREKAMRLAAAALSQAQTQG